MKKLLILVGVILGMPATASADWQGVAWGTPQANMGTAPKTHQAKGRIYQVGYDYGSEGLRKVSLKLDGSMENCSQTRNDLTSIYGQPIERSRFSITWRDTEGGNVVSFVDPLPELGTICYVIYQPLLRRGEL